MDPLEVLGAKLQAFLHDKQLPGLPHDIPKFFFNNQKKPQFQLNLGSLTFANWTHRAKLSDTSAALADTRKQKQKAERRFPRKLVQPTEESEHSNTSQPEEKPRQIRNAHRIENLEEGADGHEDIMCVEVTKGRRRLYTSRGGTEWEGFDMLDERVSHKNAMRNLIHSYMLPQGYPESVAPQYAGYMAWRGCQYFFGGAMSVFTTRSLLGALGVGGKHSGEAAAAINWVVKDGAGRLGRFLFARWGRALDCELKQFRLAGDILMEMAAAMELSTIAAPRAFLPLACTANLAKNLAAVAASSTRAPIYRTFARQNNLADVTAKGESVANLADIVGTLFGIVLARVNCPLVPTFCALSAGYLYASRREVDSVELPYLNRARLSYSARKYFETGEVPSISEANSHEPLLPWGSSSRVVLGAHVEEACLGPSYFNQLLQPWRDKPFALSFRPDTGKVYVMLREGVSSTDILRGAFTANYLLHLMDSCKEKETCCPRSPSCDSSVPSMLLDASHKADAAYTDFTRQASDLGWKLQLTMLNPQETRLRSVGPVLSLPASLSDTS